MDAVKITRRAALVSLVALAGGAVTAAQAQSAPAPAMKVGDRWVYNVKSGIGLQSISYQETREVVSISGKGGKVKVTGKTADGKDFTRVEDYARPASSVRARSASTRSIAFRRRSRASPSRSPPASGRRNGSM